MKHFKILVLVGLCISLSVAVCNAQGVYDFSFNTDSNRGGFYLNTEETCLNIIAYYGDNGELIDVQVRSVPEGESHQSFDKPSEVTTGNYKIFGFNNLNDIRCVYDFNKPYRVGNRYVTDSFNYSTTQDFTPISDVFSDAEFLIGTSEDNSSESLFIHSWTGYPIIETTEGIKYWKCLSPTPYTSDVGDYSLKYSGNFAEEVLEITLMVEYENLTDAINIAEDFPLEICCETKGFMGSTGGYVLSSEDMTYEIIDTAKYKGWDSVPPYPIVKVTVPLLDETTSRLDINFTGNWRNKLLKISTKPI